jgi:AcrR family transcriptional regulator
MKEPDRDDLPPPLDLLWGLRGRRERKQGLTVERVVAAAVELADTGGLTAVSMSRVAERLGFTTMSLYRHVRSKDELVALMVEQALGAPTALDDTPAARWRAGLERWAWELLAVVRRHPWALQVPLARLPFGPNRLSWLDRALQTLAQTALSEDEKAAVILLLNNYVFSEARTTAELGHTTQQRDPPQNAAAADPSALLALVDAERFPALRQALDAGIFDPSGSDRDADFAFGLERILDGIERLVKKRAAQRRQSVESEQAQDNTQGR